MEDCICRDGKDHTLSEYQTSSRAGCWLCSIVLEITQKMKPSWLGECDNNSRRSISVSRPYGFTFKGDGEYTSYCALVFRSDDPIYKDEPRWRHFRRSLDIISNTSSEAAFSLALAWLENCTNCHSKCNLSDPTFIPRRLIDIGSLDGTREPFLFEPSKPCRYISLSYCWGSDLDGIVKTTKSTLESYSHSIPFASLPQTLRDAIIFCRGIKISYLWIDSLCILQDDLEDWLHEAAQMRDIYSNSHLTILADEPGSCKIGFLGKQMYAESTWQRPFRTKYGGKKLGDMFLRPGRSWPEYFSLTNRGWTLQEDFLPHRKLRFNGCEMVWECNEHTLCECGCKVTTSHQFSEHAPTDVKAISTTVKAILAGREEMMKPLGRLSPTSWRYIVERYSQRRLTDWMDKLSAISGMAEMIGDAMRAKRGFSDIYLAGLWASDLIYGLTWVSQSPALCSSKLSEYRAPTWSWASVDGPVWYFGNEESGYALREEIVISEAKCSPLVPSGWTGRVKAGHIIVTGFLVPVQMVMIDQDLYEMWREPTTTFIRNLGRSPYTERCFLVRGKNLHSYAAFSDHEMNACLTLGERSHGCWVYSNCMLRKGPEKRRCRWCRFTENEESQLYCLKLYTRYDSRWVNRTLDDLKTRSSDWPRIRPPRITYLIVKKSSTVRDAYERIGIGRWEGRPGDEEHDFWGYQKELGFSLFEDAKKATIKIV